ncbi:MAG TPA: hypothetical protein VMT61_12965 [Candidatus Binataceae bacterium]|nr:hypothetical protein [Candidatus Binataceae bacterium]
MTQFLRRIALAILFLALFGCDRRVPHGVAERYLQNLQRFNYGACYQLFSDQDHRERTLAEFLTEIPLAPDVSPVWFRPLLRRTQFELGEEERSPDGLSASVPVKITTPDLPQWERILNAESGPGQLTAEAAQHSLDVGDYPVRVYNDRIFLTKEHHHWRIVGGFAARDRVVDQHRQAMNDYLEQRYEKAIPQWRSMIADLEKQNATGSPGLADRYRRQMKRLEDLVNRRAEAKAYASQMKLSDIAMKMSEQRVPGIFGTITNSGIRPVDAVALTVSWYQGRGKDLKLVYQENHTVVLTPVEFTDFTQPVVPLMPGESRPIGFILNAPPEIQQQASPYVAVGSIALPEHVYTLKRPTPGATFSPSPGASPSVGHSKLSPIPSIKAGATPPPNR